jgi:hypothetical protein
MDCNRASALLVGCLFIAASSPSFAAEPQSDGALPRYDDPVVAAPEKPPLRAVPNDGRGLLGAGGTVLTLGSISLVSGIVLLKTGDRESDSELWPLVLVGAVGTATGSLLLGLGVPKHRKYRAWEAQQTDRIPRQGLGLIGCGTALMVTGVAGGLISGTIWESQTDPFDIWLDPNPTRLAAAKVGVGLGVTSVAVGATLLATGAARGKRFAAWRKTQTVRIAPTLVPTRFGLHVGLVGRF